MPQVHFISFDGIRRSVETPIGENLMRAATDNAVPGIDGDCGGNAALQAAYPQLQTHIPPGHAAQVAQWDAH
eukprot:gene42219-56076_t